jgi:Cu2+-exporting ATPase
VASLESALNAPSPPFGDSSSASGDEITAFVRQTEDSKAIDLAVEGAHCAACIVKIEDGLQKMDGVKRARLNLSTGRLAVSFTGPDSTAEEIVHRLDYLGYGAKPYQPETADDPRSDEEKRLLRALGVAGFASANVMLLSISVWAGEGEMSLATITLMHWISGLIALPAVAYSGWPFFKNALVGLRARTVNMDLPISLAVLLACGLSIYETALGHGAAYFDAAVMLLFFLLIGRFLDVRLRARAGQAARDLAALQARIAHRIEPDGAVKAIPARDVRPGDLLRIAPGDRLPVDGEVVEGRGDVDAALVTGETQPQTLEPGALVYSGMINLNAPLTVKARAARDDSLLAEISRLVEAGEQGRSRYVRYADKAARAYVPGVFAMALITLAGWLALTGNVHDAVMNAIAVLIITCPCALALVTPAVQVVASGRLYGEGVLLKSGDALERLAEAKSVVFDKTGTLTLGRPALINADEISPRALNLTARLARGSRHPISRALAEAAGPGPMADDLQEIAGGGLTGTADGAVIQFGSSAWLGLETQTQNADPSMLEAWLLVEGEAPVRFLFSDSLRPDAPEAVAGLKAQDMPIELLSGDRDAPVAAAARALGLDRYQAGLKPQGKIDRIHALKEAGENPIMVGDGINDAPALAAAHVSVSMGSAADISRSAADLVIQGDRLAALPRAIDIAKAARARMMENFALANIYNVIAVPLAVFGLVTPLVAAIAMSASSLVVMANALRLWRA